jgi:hypothetical protein
MRVAKEERIRKETALEALESALKQRGRLRRPRRGTAGWKAIEQAICWWKGNDNWVNLPRDAQDIDLRTATAWRTYRQKGVGVMSTDVDKELLTVWTEALYYMIGDHDNDGTDDEETEAPPSSSTTSSGSRKQGASRCSEPSNNTHKAVGDHHAAAGSSSKKTKYNSNLIHQDTENKIIEESNDVRDGTLYCKSPSSSSTSPPPSQHTDSSTTTSRYPPVPLPVVLNEICPKKNTD